MISGVTIGYSNKILHYHSSKKQTLAIAKADIGVYIVIYNRTFHNMTFQEIHLKSLQLKIKNISYLIRREQGRLMEGMSVVIFLFVNAAFK